jgi:hypothetical protein
MKQIDIDKLKLLDPHGLSGTFQSVLMNPDIHLAEYSTVLYYLLTKTLEERKYYERDNQKLINVLKSEGLYTDDVLNLGGD